MQAVEKIMQRARVLLSALLVCVLVVSCGMSRALAGKAHSMRDMNEVNSTNTMRRGRIARSTMGENNAMRTGNVIASKLNSLHSIHNAKRAEKGIPSPAQSQGCNVVGLVQVRNESVVIEQCLRALAYYTDKIVVLDDGSDDNTVAIVRSLAQDLSIVTIIENSESAWQTGIENDNRQKLLDAGREVGGTHFVLIDADEMFSANCLDHNYLKDKIMTLKPGMILYMPCVNLWNGLTHYRDDEWCSPSQQRWLKPVAFCDDGVCSYIENIPQYGGPAKILHALRVPSNLKDSFSKIVKGKSLTMLKNRYVLLHFKYVHLDAIFMKKNWYMCLEFIRAQEKNNNAQENASLINTVYGTQEFKCLVPEAPKMELKPIYHLWFVYKDIDFSCFTACGDQQKNEIERWFSRYGASYFKDLHLSWPLEKVVQ